MFVKLLNGELIDIGEVENTSNIANRISHFLNVYPDQVVVCKQETNETNETNDNIPFVFIRPKPVIDMRGRDDINWEFMPYLDLSTCINTSILQYAESIREELPIFRQNQLDTPRFPRKLYAFHSFEDPSESNVNRMKASGFQQFFHIREFSLNPHDQVVDFLLAHPNLIHYPDFLGNTNQRAIEHNLKWLKEHYSRLETIFSHDPGNERKYRSFLRQSESEEIFWMVWRECPELRPRTAHDILAWVSQFHQVDVIFDEKKNKHI